MCPSTSSVRRSLTREGQGVGGKKETGEEAIDIRDCRICHWQEGLRKVSLSLLGTVEPWPPGLLPTQPSRKAHLLPRPVCPHGKPWSAGLLPTRLCCLESQLRQPRPRTPDEDGKVRFLCQSALGVGSDSVHCGDSPAGERAFSRLETPVPTRLSAECGGLCRVWNTTIRVRL